jgi:hypothetical protein
MNPDAATASSIRHIKPITLAKKKMRFAGNEASFRLPWLRFVLRSLPFDPRETIDDCEANGFVAHGERRRNANAPLRRIDTKVQVFDLLPLYRNPQTADGDLMSFSSHVD